MAMQSHGPQMSVLSLLRDNVTTDVLNNPQT